MNPEHIPHNSNLVKYFTQGISLEKDSTFIISIEADDGIKAHFDKKLAKKLNVITKSRKEIKYKVKKFRSMIQITAKETINDFKLSEIFDQLPRLSIRKAIAG